MKDFLMGCATLLVILVIAFVILLVVFSQCDPFGGSQTPSVPPTPPPWVDAMTVYLDYQENETRANDNYKGRWVTAEMGWIDRIDDGGKVLMNADQYGWNQIQFDFKDDREAARLNRGETVTAICKVQGLVWDSLLVFKDCRSVPNKVSVPTEAPTAVPVVSLEQHSCEFLAEAAQFSSKNYQPDGYIVDVMDLTVVKQEPALKECEAHVELSNGEFKLLRIRAILDDDGSVRTGYELSEIE